MHDRLDTDETGGEPSAPAYDPASDTYYATHDPADETPLSTTVLCSLLAVDGRELSELEPLGSTIDVDSLDRLLESTGGPSNHVEVRFRYHGYDVRVDGDGLVAITPLEGERSHHRRMSRP